MEIKDCVVVVMKKSVVVCAARRIKYTKT